MYSFLNLKTKEISVRLLFILPLFFSLVTFAETRGAGLPKSPTASVDAKATAIGTAYSDTYTEVLSTIAGASQFSIINGSSLGTLGLTFPLGNRTCKTAGLTAKEFTIPASSGLVVDGKAVAIGKYACIRSKSFGASLSSGVIDLTVW